MKVPRFTREDLAAAYAAWGCNCGPSTLAVVTNKTLDDVHAHIAKFDERRYTSPKMMVSALDSLGAAYKYKKWRKWPDFGLARIQWGGPWLLPGAAPSARWRHTHWVAVDSRNPNNIGIYDHNVMSAVNHTGWCSLHNWSGILVPWLLNECEPQADGTWYTTHAIEIL